MKFIDEARIFVKSGHGGPGVVSWRREKFVPRGGPDGGDGGAGGCVVFKVNSQLSTLLDFKFKKKYLAEDGEPGDRQNMTGHNGANAVISVPQGTLVKDAQSGHVLCDLNEKDQEFLLFKGGRGGKGNQFFKNAVNQAPKFSQPGEPGQEAEILLELKLLADVGIIGLPNAGKSTLISRMSAARPKIADYPFTTLVPNLGVVQGPDFKSFVIADIPGLIKGAHKGAGLGLRFLKHVERTRLFVHLIDASEFSGRDPYEDYLDLNEELRFYDEDNAEAEGFHSLSDRTQIVVLNKVDLLTQADIKQIQNKFLKKGVSTLVVSGATGLGLKTLKDQLLETLNEKREKISS